jgi:hypothetical protein
VGQAAEPRKLVVRTAPKASPLLEALVVTLHDGRVGFAARIGDVRQVDGAPLLLYAKGARDPAYEGVASVLRSGAAFEEVRGRTREATRWWARGARRSENAAVVLTPQMKSD